jgi:hypothetical protein
VGATADVITGGAMVVLQDRPVVYHSAALAAAMRESAEKGRRLQIVTSDRSRISMPLRIMLSAHQATWIVRSGNDYYDGLSGAPTHWNGAAFVPVPDAKNYAAGYLTRPATAIGAHLTLIVRARYGPNEPLGGNIERMCTALRGVPPAGWGVTEPATNRWNPVELYELCRNRTEPTWLTVIGASTAAPAGGPASVLGTALYTPSGGGIEELLTLVAAYPSSVQPPIAWLPNLVGEVAGTCRLVSLSAQLVPGPLDLTTEPRWTGSPAPIGLAVAPELGGGTAAPAGVRTVQLGSISWYELGNGTATGDWERYHQLMALLSARQTP